MQQAGLVTALLQLAPPDGTRDPRIEDPTNSWIVHPAARALLPLALRLGVSANSVSLAGVGFGAAAAACYLSWWDWRMAAAGLLLSVGWLVADGLDGMVARATGTASPWGRILDGLCDHGVFGLLYIAVAVSVGTIEAWLLGLAASGAHAVQASLYEAERIRYHRRLRGDPCPDHPPSLGNPLVRAYDAVAHSLDRAASTFDKALARRPELIARYGNAAAPPMRLLALVSANMRVLALFLACLAGDPQLLWWTEIAVMTPIAAAGIAWHRRVEKQLIA